MCNLSQGIKEQAYAEGTENGIDQHRQGEHPQYGIDRAGHPGQGTARYHQNQVDDQEGFI